MSLYVNKNHSTSGARFFAFLFLEGNLSEFSFRPQNTVAAVLYDLVSEIQLNSTILRRESWKKDFSKEFQNEEKTVNSALSIY